MSQVYMTAKLNLADGTILYPQVSLDNIVASISDPTLVSVATTTNGKVPVTELPVVTVVGDTGSNNNIPTEAAVRALADTKQNTLVAGTGTEIINGSTINAMAVNLNDVVVNNVPNNGLYLEVEGNTMSVVAQLAGATAGIPGTVAEVDGVLTLSDGIIGLDIGSGLKTGAYGTTDADKLVIDDAEVGTVLLDTRDAVSPVEDQVVTPGNLRGALSVGQAVDVGCSPRRVQGFDEISFDDGETWQPITDASHLDTTFSQDAFLGGFSVRKVNVEANTQCYIGFQGSYPFPKKATDLWYACIADVRNSGIATTTSYHDISGQGGKFIPGVAYRFPTTANQTTYTRIALEMSGNTGLCYLIAQASTTGTIQLDIKNWRQYEVTALTDEAIAYIAQLPDPDAFFRSASIYSLRDKYLVKQDMVCPFIPTIGMPDNSDLTVAAGLSYKIKYTNDNPHTITADTIPSDGYGWDTHIQMFIKGTSSIVFQKPLILMDALTPNAGHNLSVKWRNGDALVYVDDTNAGNIVISTSGTTAGTLNYFLQQDPGSGQDNYIIFAATTDNATCDAGTVTVNYNTDVLGNGTDKTSITGNISVASGKTMNLQSLSLAGGTFSSTNYDAPNRITMDNVLIPVNSTVAIGNRGVWPKSLRVEGTLVNMNGIWAYNHTYTPFDISGKGVIDGQGLYTIELPGEGAGAEGSVYNISGVTIQNGLGKNGTSYGNEKYGGGVLLTNTWGSDYIITCALNDVLITGCTGVFGSAICGLMSTSIEMTGCTITNNTGRSSLFMGKSGVHPQQHLTITDCFFDTNGTIGFVATGEVMSITLAGNNKMQTVFANYGGVGLKFILADNSTLDMTGNSAASGSGLVINASNSLGLKNQCFCGDNVTFVLTTGTTASIDACNFCRAYCTIAQIEPDTGTYVTITSDLPVWHATNIRFVSGVDAHAVNTVKLQGTEWRSTSQLLNCSRLQLPAGSTNSFVGNTNAADTKILEAPVIVVGDDAAAPSGSATVVNAAGTSFTVSGIGTYIDKEGDNDFVPLTNVSTVSTSATSGAGSLPAALTGSNKFVRLGDGTVGTVGEATNAVDKTLMTNDYEPILGGTFSLTSATVDEATKTVAIQSGGTMSIVDVRGGKDSVIDLGGTNVELNGTRISSASLSGCTLTSGSATYGGAVYAAYGVSATLRECSITGNSAGYGGGCNAGGGSYLLVDSCVVTGNSDGDIRVAGASTSILISASTVGTVNIAGGTVNIAGRNTIDVITSKGGSGSVTISSGAILDLTGNTNPAPIAPGGGITFEEGGATVYPSAGQASAYMLGGMTVPTIGNTNVVNLGGSAHVSPAGGSAVLISGATVQNGESGFGVVYLVDSTQVFDASNTTLVDTHGEHALFMNAGTANLNNTALYGNAYLRHGNGAVVVNIAGSCGLHRGYIGFPYNSTGYAVNISSGATLDFTDNATPTTIYANDGIVVDGGCQVITSAGTTVSVAGGTYTKINNDGTTE